MAINYELINKGGISLGTNFELLSEKPLDSRLVVPSLDGLQNYIDSAAAYEGMIAYVSSEKKHYEVKVIDGVLSYRPFGLTEAELNDLITNATTAAMEFKGATATLPENPAKGDMYKVAGENINIKIDDVDAKLGDSIVYDGAKWFLIPSGDDIEDTWRPVEGVNNDATLKFVDGDKTVAAVAADGTVKYNHATVAAPADVTAEGDEKTRTYITAVETDGYGHITGYKTATENVEDTNTEYTFESQVESSSVYFNVTPNTEGATEETIYVDAYSKNEADGKFVAKETGKSLVSDDEIARLAGVDNYDDEEVRGLINAIDNHSHENKDVIDGITAAKVADWDDAVSKEHTHSFADSDVEDAITKKHSHTFTDADVEDAISKEHTHSFSDETALNGITAAKVADWDDAVSKEHTHTFVDSDVEDAISKKHAHTFADTDVEDAISKKHSHTFVEAELNKIADGDVAKWNTAAGKADDNAQAIEDLEGYVGTFTHATAKTVVEYINAKTDGIATSGNLEALGTRVTAVEGDVATIKGDYLKAADIANFETKENVKKVADDLAAYVESNDAALAAETKARTDADAGFETRIAALEGNFGDGEGTVEAQIAAAVKVEEDARKEAVKGVQDEVDAVEGRMDAAEGKITALETESAKHAIKTEVEGALALKADKSVVDGMYTNGQIDTAVQSAKDYAKGLVDAIPAQTDYTVTITETTDGLASDVAKKYTFTQNGAEIGTINLAKELVVTSGSVKEVTTADAPYAGAKVGEKYIELVIANQDAPIYVPAKDLVDVYTAKDGATEVQVAISNTNEISATLVNGGITEEKLAEGVKTKLNKTWEEVGVAAGLVEGLENGQVKTNKEAIDAINNADTGILKQAKEYADGLKEASDALIAGSCGDLRQELVEAIDAAKSDAIVEAGKLDAQLVSDINTNIQTAIETAATTAQEKVDALANGQVKTNTEAIATKANAADVYAKTETYNKTEIEALLTWGSF